jgi:hypothetical protein
LIDYILIELYLMCGVLYMIDRTMRHHLADSIEALVSGAIDTDEFVATIEECSRSADLGVVEISRFSRGLFHDLYPYKLNDNQIDEHTTLLVRRSVLFLRSSCEYQWPKLPEFKFSTYLFICGLILLLLALVAAWSSLSVLWYLVLMTTGAILLVSVFTYQSIRQKQISAQYWSHVDKAVWPFIRQSDCLAALEQSLPL